MNESDGPEDMYVISSVLMQVDEIIKADKENYDYFDWILPLAYCAFLFDEIIRTKLDKTLFLKNQERLFVTVGHDSGDYMELSPIE